MENAGRNCVETLLQVGCSGPVSIVCGGGNNAGDGFVIARHLMLHGISCQLLLLTPSVKFTGDALINFEIVSHLRIPIHDLSLNSSTDELKRLAGTYNNRPVEWVVDAMLGTGATGPLRDPFRIAVSAINNISAKKFAVDIPTGLDCDSGEAQNPTFLADVTCTFVAMKPGLALEANRKYCGEVHVVDIGIPTQLVTQHAK